MFADQIGMLYQQTANSLGLGLLAGLVLVVMLWNLGTHLALLAWLVAVIFASVLRLALAHFYLVDGPSRSTATWRNLYVFGVFASGLIWASIAWQVDVSWPQQYQFALLLVLAAVAAAGAWVNSAYFYASASFVVPIMASVLVMLLFQHGAYQVMAVLVVIFSAILLQHAYRHHHDLLENLHLRYENEHLVVSLQTSNDQLLEQQAILERDSLLAQRVFRKLTQQDGRPITGVSFWEYAAADFSGDLLLITERPDGGFMLFLGDFTGHGLPSALGAVPASTIFYSMTRKGLDLEDIVAELNFRLREYLPAEYFCCGVFVQGDLRSGKLRIWNAGLPPILHVARDGIIKNRIRSSQVPLGIVPYEANELHCEEVRLLAGDSLYVFTDGLTEAENKEGEMFGENHFESVLKTPRFGESRLESVKSAVLGFLAGLPAHDDVSLVELSMPSPPNHKMSK